MTYNPETKLIVTEDEREMECIINNISARRKSEAKKDAQAGFVTPTIDQIMDDNSIADPAQSPLSLESELQEKITDIYYGEADPEIGTMASGVTTDSQRFGQSVCDRSSVQDDFTAGTDNNASVATSDTRDSAITTDTSNDTRKRKKAKGSSVKSHRKEQCLMLNMDLLK